MTGARQRRILLAILAVALLLRLAHWAAVREAPFVGQLVMDSEEYDRWGSEIASGDWLGSEPFYQAPLYPYLLGSIYRLAGPGAHGYRLDAVYLLQILAAVAGCWALFRAGLLLAGPQVGLAAAGLGAVYGPFIFYDVQLLKESLAVSTVCFLLWALVAGGQRREVRIWLGVGALLGILILLRENTLLVIPFLLPLTLLNHRRQAWRRVAGLFAGTVLVLSPVALRNAAVGGGFLPTTFQGGVNFFIGNNPEADGTYRPIVPGRQIPAYERREPVRLAELALGRELTPRQVSGYWLGLSLDWARAHPGDFMALQLEKLRLFWSWYEWPDAVDYYYMASISPILGPPLFEFGGAVLLAAAGLWMCRKRLRDWSPVLLFLLGWVLSTAIFFIFSRYRLPAVPALLLLGAVPIARLAGVDSPNRFRTIALWGLLVAALLLPHLASAAPRWDLVHYNVGLLALRQGRLVEARSRFETALEANPEFLSASLEMGNMAQRRGDLQAALAWHTRATQIEPRCESAWSNLGGVLTLLGRGPEARAALQRAIDIDPRSLVALNNMAILHLRRGDPLAASLLIERSLVLDPTYPPALSLRRRLEAEGAASDAAGGGASKRPEEQDQGEPDRHNTG